jgi:hypothetical protein
MKKLLSIISGVLITVSCYAQPYFQGTFLKDPAYATNNKIIFRMNPTANITTAIGYIEFAFRYPTAAVTAFNVANITSNTTTFPGLVIQRLPDFVSGGFTYVKFVHNTATISSNTYVPNPNGFDLFTITTQGTPATLPQVDMASDALGTGDLVFGVADGGGNFLNPGAGNQLYGPGFNINGGIHLVPLTNIVLPVKFTSFTATKKDNDALLNWTVENETASTDYYEIERSVDGITFEKVQTITPLNNGNSSNVYNNIDANLTTISKVGLVVYYRIKQVDIDGKSTYTDIKNVRLSNKENLITAYPNPIREFTNIQLEMANADDVRMSLLNADGKILQDFSLKLAKGINIRKIDMNNLPTGNYVLKVLVGEKMETIKLIKL